MATPRSSVPQVQAFDGLAIQVGPSIPKSEWDAIGAHPFPSSPQGTFVEVPGFLRNGARVMVQASFATSQNLGYVLYVSNDGNPAGPDNHVACLPQFGVYVDNLPPLCRLNYRVLDANGNPPNMGANDRIVIVANYLLTVSK